VLIEPVHIGKRATVRDSIIGPHVSVAEGSVIEQSIIRDSIINSNSVVRDMLLQSSILGDYVELTGSRRPMNIGDHSLVELQGERRAYV